MNECPACGLTARFIGPLCSACDLQVLRRRLMLKSIMADTLGWHPNRKEAEDLECAQADADPEETAWAVAHCRLTGQTRDVAIENLWIPQ